MVYITGNFIFFSNVSFPKKEVKPPSLYIKEMHIALFVFYSIKAWKNIHQTNQSHHATALTPIFIMVYNLFLTQFKFYD
jgi:hypothetical protein